MIKNRLIEMNDWFYADVYLEDQLNDEGYVLNVTLKFDPLEGEMIEVSCLNSEEFYDFLDTGLRMDPIRLKKFNYAIASFIDEFKQEYKQECESI